MADLKAALKSLHAVGISAIADWVPDQIYNLPGDEVVTATRVNNYGETKDGAIINHSSMPLKHVPLVMTTKVNMVVPSLMN